MNTVFVVIGSHFSTSLGIIRALGECGYLVDMYFLSRYHKDKIKILSSSKYIHRFIEQPKLDEIIIVDDLLSLYKAGGTYYVLIPTDDYCASLIDRFYSKLSPVFKMPHVRDGKEGMITRLMDKSIQLQLGNEYKLNTPISYQVFLPHEDDINIPDRIPYPCYVKPLLSVQGRKTEMRKCNSQSELRSTLLSMRKKKSDRTVLVQEFLDIEDEFSISGVSLDQTVILPALLHRIYIGKYMRGVTIVGELVPIDNYITFQEQIREMIKSLHFTGLFCVDLIKSKGTIYFSELNFRCAGSLYGYVRAGANLPAILADHYLGNEEVRRPDMVRYGTKFFYEMVGWDDLLHGYCTTKDFKKYIKEADFSLINDERDPKPYVYLQRNMKYLYFKNRIKEKLPFVMKAMKSLKRRK